jgi:DNA-directed RNA polymerase subunit K/omega
MSDSDYESDSSVEPDTEDEDQDNITIKIKDKSTSNAIKPFGDYTENESDDDADLEEVEDDDDADNDEEAAEIKGGASDDENEEGEIKDDAEEEEDIEEGDQVENTNFKIKPIKTTQLIIHNEADDDDDDDDDAFGENYLKKFDRDVNKSYINEFHPECLNHNSDEVSKLAKVYRDDNNNIVDGLHKTLPYLTKYEKARILGQRAKQIETGSKPLVRVPENIIDAYVIAELELREKKIPFIIKRPIPNGAFEYWHLKDLEIIVF